MNAIRLDRSGEWVAGSDSLMEKGSAVKGWVVRGVMSRSAFTKKKVSCSA